jgi:hypothetical protein
MQIVVAMLFYLKAFLKSILCLYISMWGRRKRLLNLDEKHYVPWKNQHFCL